MSQTLYAKVNNYRGQNNFMNSLRNQYLKYGRLSPKQLACAEKFFDNSAKPLVKEFSRKAGEKITIKKWLARRTADKLKMPFFFRNLIIEEVTNETSRAIEVKVRFNSQIATCCHICGRGLDNEISKATGIGPVCASKYLKVKRPTLENANEIIAKIEEEAKNAGVVGPLWIPKSQIITQAEQVLYGVE